MVADISPSTDQEGIHLGTPDIPPRTEESIHLGAPDVSPSTNEERIDPGAPDISPSTEDRIHLDPVEVKKHFDRIGRFRILVIGRSNAGKTTLLQRVCNTTELPDIFNANGEKVNMAGDMKCTNYVQRGCHNIEDEVIFQNNSGFVFHDSRGFDLPLSSWF
ncbi:hypothetical protein SCLCIDRAFT_105491 [Scleroderma citrinum Foug A]|uniref:Uncharacterized protein n=1 Tax=Scleroderma citrinum Foug A TaxID=1036808 RepID=A0A0C3E6S6_9AGAM|nr:hypothetical protein SCLCIDRAFT_105491 [Scleroderma citrinum Foug A]